MWLERTRKMPLLPPQGDGKIVSPISTFVLNSLTLKEWLLFIILCLTLPIVRLFVEVLCTLHIFLGIFTQSYHCNFL